MMCDKAEPKYMNSFQFLVISLEQNVSGFTLRVPTACFCVAANLQDLRLSLRLGDGEREDLVSSIDFPIAVRWSKVLSDHSRNNFNKATREDYSRILDGLQDDDITWQPYIRLQALPLDDCCSRQQTVARSRIVLICYEKAIYLRPEGGDACHGGDDTFSQGGDACQTDEQDHTVDIQVETLRKISSSYDRDKKFWAVAVSNMEEKIKVMKEQHFQLSSEAHICANSIPDWTIMISAIQSLVSQCEDLKVKYNEEHQERRKLYNHHSTVSQCEDLKFKYNEEHQERREPYNQVQEAKGMFSIFGNIRVFCRCLPLSKTEVAVGHATVVDFDAAKDGELGILMSGSTKKKFSFDRVYTSKDDQVDVFVDGSPMVISVLDGYNVCIFAYGQTGRVKRTLWRVLSKIEESIVGLL